MSSQDAIVVDRVLDPKTLPARGYVTWRMSGHIVESMTVADPNKRVRDSSERRIWGDVFADLSAAHREGPLAGEDLERQSFKSMIAGAPV